MQGYFKKKAQNSPRPSEHPPVVGGKKQTQNTREAWDTTQFLEFVTLHIYRCRRDPGYVQYHRNNYVIISSTYQNAPGPSEHTNIKVGSEAAITELLHGIRSTV